MYLDHEAIGQRVRVLRNSRGVTNEKLSEELDYSHSHVSKAECGIRCYSVDLLICLSRYFDVSLDYLILGEEGENANTKRCMRILLKEMEGLVNKI